MLLVFVPLQSEPLLPTHPISGITPPQPSPALHRPSPKRSVLTSRTSMTRAVPIWHPPIHQRFPPLSSPSSIPSSGFKPVLQPVGRPSEPLAPQLPSRFRNSRTS